MQSIKRAPIHRIIRYHRAGTESHPELPTCHNRAKSVGRIESIHVCVRGADKNDIAGTDGRRPQMAFRVALTIAAFPVEPLTA